MKGISVGPIEKTVNQCLQDHYRLSGELVRLSGENLNYLLTTRKGSYYVVKIVGEDMPSKVAELEMVSMEYANRAGFSLDLPKICRNERGNIETGIQIHTNDLYRLKLLTYISGSSLDSITDISSKLIKNIGYSMADYHRAMRGFDHPAAHRSHRWDLVEAGQHRDKIKRLKEPEEQSILEWGFSSWDQVRGALDS